MEENQTLGLIDTEALLLKLGIGRATLARWREFGLPAHPAIPDGKLYFDLAEVRAWIKRENKNSEGSNNG